MADLSSSPAVSRRLLACLCAAWCGTCRDYRPLFDEVANKQPGTAVFWLDIEDEADSVGDIDVETFPTLLVADVSADDPAAVAVRFFGPLLPHAQTLARLAESLGAPDASAREAAGLAPEVRALARRLAAAPVSPSSRP